MKHINEGQYEQTLHAISNLKEIGAPDFFYVRLKARMENDINSSKMDFFTKPAILFCALCFFLFLNIMMLIKESDMDHKDKNQNIELLAASYDQTI